MRVPALAILSMLSERNDNVILVEPKIRTDIGSRGVPPGAYYPQNMASLPTLFCVSFTWIQRGSSLPIYEDVPLPHCGADIRLITYKGAGAVAYPALSPPALRFVHPPVHTPFLESRHNRLNFRGEPGRENFSLYS
jgi:hypothetical protein